MHSAASPAKATPQPNLWRDCWGLGKDLWKGRIQNWRTLPGWWCFFGKRFGNNIGARIATSSPSRGWNIRKLFETPRPQKKGLGYPQMEVWNMNFFTASMFSCWGVRKIEKTQANCFRGISISHLGKRKIRDSKMPTGRGYISFQEGTSWSFLVNNFSLKFLCLGFKGYLMVPVEFPETAGFVLPFLHRGSRIIRWLQIMPLTELEYLDRKPIKKIAKQVPINHVLEYGCFQKYGYPKMDGL